MKQPFKFEIGQIVVIDGLECEILERDDSWVEGDDNDYLARPLDASKMILGQDQLGAGWVFEKNIRGLK